MLERQIVESGYPIVSRRGRFSGLLREAVLGPSFRTGFIAMHDLPRFALRLAAKGVETDGESERLGIAGHRTRRKRRA